MTTTSNRNWNLGLTRSLVRQTRRFFGRIAGAAIVFLIALTATAATKATTEVIYSFAGGADGEYLDTDVAIDAAGNLYGTSVLGGTFGGGTVWQLSQVNGSWVHTVLYNFTGGADGGEPYKGVTLDAEGNLYGTAVTGGSGSCEGGCGVTYKLSKNGSTWTQTVLYAFTGADDGSGPGSRVTLDQQGNVYGMTPTGGAFGLGTIYTLRPKANDTWNLQVLHAFTGGVDGSSGSAGKMVFHQGALFGAATTGGAYGHGTIFRLKPQNRGQWTFQSIYSFLGDLDGSFPYGGLTIDLSDNIFGTTYYGGTDGIGTVFQLSFARGGWVNLVLYSFKSGTDGNSPISNVGFDTMGNIYGTTSEGGLGSGTIFQLIPVPGGSWSETLAHVFAGSPDGAFPYSGMTPGADNTFYGATVHGGANGEGSIYKFTP
jgi:uncharacterized repeat protein (TIGR03803 family)